jgi:hypothetical protein
MQKLGIDFCGDTRRVARVETSTGSVEVTALHEISSGEPISPLSQAGLPVTIAVPDNQAIVRVVQTAAVDLSLGESAARFEAAVALVSQDSFVRTTVEQIALPGTTGRWLTSSVHETVLVELTSRALAGHPQSNQVAFITRSVALGRGYLQACETPENPCVVVIQPTVHSTAICFLSQSAIVGTAQLRGIDTTAADPGDGECARWISELEMIVKYRLGSDLALFYGGAVPALILAAEVETVNRLSAISPVVFAPVSIKADLKSRSDSTTPLTPEWLIPIGAAFN